MSNALTTSQPMSWPGRFAEQAMPFLKGSALTLILSACVLTLHTVSDLTPWLTFEFGELSFAGLYRLMTCHGLHWSANHLAWDLAMFGVLGCLCERRSRGKFIVTLLVSAVVIPLIVMVAHPELGSYRGLSGLDSALFGLLVADYFTEGLRARNWGSVGLFGVMGAAMFGKIALEILAQGNLFVSDNSFTPVPLAHLIGAIVGLVVGAWSWRRVNPLPSGATEA